MTCNWVMLMPEADQALAADALESPIDGPEVGDDAALPWSVDRLAVVNASCHVNYHTPANHRVNVERFLPTQEAPMRFALMLEPQQGLSYGDQVAIAKRAEANGFETLFRSDHYASFPGPAGQPTTDAWTVMAGLARETDRIGLGRARLAGHVPPSGQLRQGRRPPSTR